MNLLGKQKVCWAVTHVFPLNCVRTFKSDMYIQKGSWIWPVGVLIIQPHCTPHSHPLLLHNKQQTDTEMFTWRMNLQRTLPIISYPFEILFFSYVLALTNFNYIFLHSKSYFEEGSGYYRLVPKINEGSKNWDSNSSSSCS